MQNMQEYALPTLVMKQRDWLGQNRRNGCSASRRGQMGHITEPARADHINKPGTNGDRPTRTDGRVTLSPRRLAEQPLRPDGLTRAAESSQRLFPEYKPR
jgi:hypothetical protein